MAYARPNIQDFTSGTTNWNKPKNPIHRIAVVTVIGGGGGHIVGTNTRIALGAGG